MKQPNLFDAPDEMPGPPPPPDQAARDFAVDPRNDVVLEASAGTGKTRVLVERYVRLIEQNVDPKHILAITFTRKAAAEMRERVLATLRGRAQNDARMAARWAALRERLSDIQISTIDAFCFGLLREFPLEARVDPAFEIADETEMARFQNEALDLTLRAARGLVAEDENVRLLFAKVKLPVLRDGLATLIDRRQVSVPAVNTFVAQKVRCATGRDAGAQFLERLRWVFEDRAIRRAIVDDGPAGAPEYVWLQGDLQRLDTFPPDDAGLVRQLHRRLERYFLTKAGEPRSRLLNSIQAAHFASPEAKKRHEAAMKAVAPDVLDALQTLDADVNGLLARGLARVLAVTVDKYERLLEEHALIDFAGMLEKSVALLDQQEEFARSRLKLQSRYHHILVDEFQDTSRLQWRLIDRLVDAWAEGEGPADEATSIFVVGDRKQSIYRFRHAEVTLLDEAARKIVALRPGRRPQQAIAHSYRAVPELLAFVNRLSEEIVGDAELDDRFRYDEHDRFLVGRIEPGARRDGQPVLGLIAQPTMKLQAAAVASEIARLVESGTAVRDGDGMRAIGYGDIAILFRARAGHQHFETALASRGIPTYVYKGLGFFDAPEVQDVQALIRYLAQPDSNLRAAEFLRSRFVRLSDVGLRRLAPALAEALRAPAFDLDAAALDPIDRALLAQARESLGRWLPAVDRVTPSELLDAVLAESAYAYEMRGPRLDQARENLKKLRALVRRVENRGYATVGRLADYFDTLRTGEESNAVIDASGCVNLMTIHAAKGLEFPIVFIVNLHVQGRGRAGGFTVIERGADDTPSVVFGANEDSKYEDRRETEELRRLMYVAATRARDRLYLGAEVDPKGALRRGARSLATLLPQTLADQFTASVQTDAADVEWPSDALTFAMRVCRVSPAPDTVQELPTATVDDLDDVEPLTCEYKLRNASVPGERRDDTSQFVGDARDRLIGTVVHRLFQHHRQREPGGDLSDTVAALLRPHERADVDDLAAFSADAAALFVRMRQSPDVRALLASGDCVYEVPFSVRSRDASGDIVRGRIDCMVIPTTGGVTVLEFKTGVPHPSHARQLSLYVAAARQLFPDREIHGKTVYP
jgi:ATP-dependent helicase/nuclease subunit A